jgi:hypothetical protein
MFRKGTIFGHAFRQETFQRPRLLAEVDFYGVHKRVASGTGESPAFVTNWELNCRGQELVAMDSWVA